MKFDVERASNETVSWVRDWFYKNGRGCNCIIGVSGGKDSSVAASVCVEALGRERVIGVMMPNKDQLDIDMAKYLVNHLGIRSFTVNIGSAFDSLVKEIRKNVGDLSDDSIINLPPRLRMSTLYAIAQSHNGRVANTCNLSEDWVGYSTRYGDSVGDFSPLSSFTTAEVRAIGRHLGLPDILIDKVPSDGLSGKTDEDKLGFTYEVLDKYIRTGKINDIKTKERIDMLHKKNLFKLRYMDHFVYSDEHVLGRID